MDDEADTYKLWKIRKTIMQVMITATVLFSYFHSNWYAFSFIALLSSSCATIEAIWSRRTS